MQLKLVITLIIDTDGIIAFVWQNGEITRTFTYVFDEAEIYQLTLFNITLLIQLVRDWFTALKISANTPVVVIVDLQQETEVFVPDHHKHLITTASDSTSLQLKHGVYSASLAEYKRAQYHLWALQTPFTLVGISTVTLLYYYAHQQERCKELDWSAENFSVWNASLKAACHESNSSKLYWYEQGSKYLIEKFL